MYLMAAQRLLVTPVGAIEVSMVVTSIRVEETAFT